MPVILKTCLFCLRKTDDGIEIFERVGEEFDVQEIINKYFWFDVIQMKTFQFA